MANYAAVARPYAKATFQVAQASKSEEHWASVLDVLKAVMTHNQMGYLLTDPTMTRAVWKSLFVDVLQSACAEACSALGDQLQRFLDVIISAHREAVLPDMADRYHQLLVEAQGIKEVSMTTAFPLSDQEKISWHERLKTQFSAKVNLTFTVDSDLIGGAILRSGDWVKDGSVRGKLNRLAQQLVGNNVREGV